MPLQKQIQAFPLLQGVDTKTDPLQLSFGQLSTLENGVFTNPKEIQKRNGYSVFPSVIDSSDGDGGNITSGLFISSFQNELIQGGTTSGSVLPAAYSFSDGIQKWTNKGPFSSATITNKQVSSKVGLGGSTSFSNQDGAYNSNGLFLSCWEGMLLNGATAPARSSSNSFYSIIDYATGEVMAANVEITGGISPKVVSLGGFFFLFYVNQSTGQLRLITIPAGAPLAPNNYVVAGAADATNPLYDVCVNSTTIYIAFNTGSAISINTTDAGLVVNPGISVGGEVASGAINVSVALDSGYVWVLYYNGSNLKAFARNSDLTTNLSPTTVTHDGDTAVRNISAYASSQIVYAFVETYATTGNLAQAFQSQICTVRVNISGAATHSAWLTNLGLVSKPFFVDKDQNFLGVVAVFQSSFQSTYFVVTPGTIATQFVDPSTFVAAKILPGAAGGLTNIVTNSTYVSATLCEVYSIDSSNFAMALLQQNTTQYLAPKTITNDSQNIFANYTQLGVVYSTFSINSQTYQRQSIANGFHLTGGYLNLYDGTSVTEHGFHLYPQNMIVTPSSTGGNLSDGTYNYKVVYEWIDNFGQTHKSAPTSVGGVGAVSGSSGSGSVSIKVPTLPLTSKTGVSIVLYRTNDAGTAYYRVPIVTTNNPAVTYQEIMDGVTAPANSSDYSGYEELYTDTGEVDNDPVPSCNLIFSYKTRVCVVPTEDTSAFFYSKDVEPGVPVEFSESFKQNITTVGGGITAGVQLDSNLVLFKQRNIAVMSGSGPNLNGTGNDFSEAQLLPTDAGVPAANANSVVSIPTGIIFQSEKGIYLLDRTLSVSYIGAEVEAYNGDTVTSARLVPDTREVRFTLSSGVSLTYDYFIQKWSVSPSLVATSATIWNGIYTYLNPTDGVMQETDEFTDNEQFIPLHLTTGWINLSGIQGFQRIYRILLLGQWKSAHTLQVSLSFDYNPNPFQTASIDASASVMGQDNVFGGDSPYGNEATYGGTYEGLYQWQVYPNIQRCESIKIDIVDSQVLPYGEGYSLSNIALEMGVEGGLYRLPASRKTS